MCAQVRGATPSSGATELVREGEPSDHWSHALVDDGAETDLRPRGGGGTAVKSKPCPTPAGENPEVRGRSIDPRGGVVSRDTNRGRSGESATWQPGPVCLGTGAGRADSHTGAGDQVLATALGSTGPYDSAESVELAPRDSLVAEVTLAGRARPSVDIHPRGAENGWWSVWVAAAGPGAGSSPRSTLAANWAGDRF